MARLLPGVMLVADITATTWILLFTLIKLQYSYSPIWSQERQLKNPQLMSDQGREIKVPDSVRSWFYVLTIWYKIALSGN